MYNQLMVIIIVIGSRKSLDLPRFALCYSLQGHKNTENESTPSVRNKGLELVRPESLPHW